MVINTVHRVCSFYMKWLIGSVRGGRFDENGEKYLVGKKCLIYERGSEKKVLRAF